MDAVDRLLELRQQCRDGESDDEHAAHAADLEAAYLAVQQETGGTPESSNPGDEPGEYALTADVQVSAEQTVG